MAEKIGEVIKRLVPQLRPYQFDMVRATFLTFLNNPGQVPCIVAPTGSGKSWVIAGLCKVIMEQFANSRILVLAHRKELLEQNKDKLERVNVNIPIGLYSAGLKQRDIRSVTFAGIQSIYKHAADLGNVDLTIIDEAHLISTRNMGTYRQLLRELAEINPAMKVVGLTATPFRTGVGYITDEIGGERLFTPPLIQTVTIPELIDMGYLARLVSRVPDILLNVDNVAIRQGDYVAKQLEAAVNNNVMNAKIAAEIKARGEADNRRAWLVFCAGIKHAHAMYEELRQLSVDCAVLTGSTPSDERRHIIDDFNAGRLRALVNVNVLTTGYDNPNIDLIAGCRPTLSPVLYTQMAGRGMRLKDADRPQDCLYLDFANNIGHLGPITDLKIDKGAPEPTRQCPNCKQLNPRSNKKCSICGYEFPPKVKECPRCKNAVPEGEHICPLCYYDFWRPRKDAASRLKTNGHTHDILAPGQPLPEQEVAIRSWNWAPYRRRNALPDERPMLLAKYYPVLPSGHVVKEYFPVNNSNSYAHLKAIKRINKILREVCSLQIDVTKKSFSDESVQLIADKLNEQSAPTSLVYQECKGKPWDTVISRTWGEKGQLSNGNTA